MDGASLEVRIADRKAAGKADVDETRPALVASPTGQIMLVYEEIAPDAPRRIIARRLEVSSNKPE